MNLLAPGKTRQETVFNLESLEILSPKLLIKRQYQDPKKLVAKMINAAKLAVIEEVKKDTLEEVQKLWKNLDSVLGRDIRHELPPVIPSNTNLSNDHKAAEILNTHFETVAVTEQHKSSLLFQRKKSFEAKNIRADSSRSHERF